MGKAIGLLLAVVAIWITVEIYTQGSDAFGGRLASVIGDRNAAPRGSTAQRVRAAVDRANQERDAHYDRLPPE